MNMVDSSAWLEYFTNGSNAHYFSDPIENVSKLVVPTLSICEVFKKVLQQVDESRALQAVATMQQGLVVELGTSIALTAARLSMDHSLPMADSIILATARTNNAILWTQDSHFKGLPEVKYKKKK